MSTLRILNVISINKEDLDLNEVRSKFTHPNPRFFENARLGFSNFGVSRDIPLFNENGNLVYFPRGLVREVASLKPNFEFQDETVTNPVHFKPSQIILKSYQMPALEAMLNKNQGVIEAPPGSGKTVVGIEAILKRSQKSLVLVHTKDLLRQWCDRFEQFADMTAGIIDADRFDLRDVTVGMVQSLRKPLDSSFVKQWGLVILDEAHHAPAYTFEQLLNQFPAKYRYGLTATPNRRDGLSFVLYAVLGSTIFKIDKEGLFESGEIMKPTIRLLNTNFFNPLITDYRDLLECVVMDGDRNSLILRNVIREAEEGHYCLVLSNRIDHAEWLYQTLSTTAADIRGEVLTSRVSKDDRSAVIKEVNEGKIRILCATQLGDEGLDVRCLDRLFLTCPIRSVNKVSQQIGRIVRTFPGKADAIVYDFRDHLCSLAESQFQTRLKQIYEPSKYQIEEVPFENGSDGHE
jgi:superfamily II DNA or RNA helicase